MRYDRILEETECELCMEQIDTKYSWVVHVRYCTGGGFYKRRLCSNCVSKLTGAPMDRIRFEECLCEYRKEFRISKYNREPVSMEHLMRLKKILDDRKIPIRDYGIPFYHLCPNNYQDTPQYLHKILGFVV